MLRCKLVKQAFAAALRWSMLDVEPKVFVWPSMSFSF